MLTISSIDGSLWYDLDLIEYVATNRRKLAYRDETDQTVVLDDVSLFNVRWTYESWPAPAINLVSFGPEGQIYIHTSDPQLFPM